MPRIVVKGKTSKMVSFLKKSTAFTLLGFAAAFLNGCEENSINKVTLAQTACVSLQAQITIADGYFRALCGCDENSTAYIVSGQTLTCTVPAGTTVFFNYAGTQFRHQVTSTGTPGFGTSPMSDPTDSLSAKSFATKIDTTGTYLFSDPFNPEISGTIVVR